MFWSLSLPVKGKLPPPMSFRLKNGKETNGGWVDVTMFSDVDSVFLAGYPVGANYPLVCGYSNGNGPWCNK